MYLVRNFILTLHDLMQNSNKFDTSRVFYLPRFYAH